MSEERRERGGRRREAGEEGEEEREERKEREVEREVEREKGGGRKRGVREGSEEVNKEEGGINHFSAKIGRAYSGAILGLLQDREHALRTFCSYS